MRTSMTLALAIQHFRRAVLGSVAFVIVAMALAAILDLGFGRDNLLGLSRKANPFVESSLHTWLGSALLLLCGVLLLLIGIAKRREERPFAWHWIVLGCGFLYLSLDETVMVHEMTAGWAGTLTGRDGLPSQFWALLAAPLGVVLLVGYWRFIRHLPVNFRRCVFMSGACYVGGAIGMEALFGVLGMVGQPGRAVLQSLGVIEESLELLGAAFFLCGIAQYLATGAEVGLTLQKAADDQVAA